jgi:D-glycero-D-manno-heptose 1,7-bisphosphate phosphatase
MKPLQHDFVHLPENSRLPYAARRGAIFLDRDGVLNKDVHFLTRLDDIHILPGVAEALRDLQGRFHLIVITNQSGIARGYITEAELHTIQMEMSRQLAEAGCIIDAYYFCPHHPQGNLASYAIDCACRKPKPGMIARAAADWNIDLPASYLIGDRTRDVEAGRAAGVKSILLTKSPPELPFDCLFAADLRAAALQYIHRV